MSTAKIVALVLWILAVILFVMVGLHIVETAKYDLVALGLASAWAGMIIHEYVP